MRRLSLATGRFANNSLGTLPLVTSSKRYTFIIVDRKIGRTNPNGILMRKQWV